MELCPYIQCGVAGTETFGCGGGNKSESEAYTPDNSGTSENSDNTVIFLPDLSAKSANSSISEYSYLFCLQLLLEKENLEM